jgi:hypothetical protein
VAEFIEEYNPALEALGAWHDERRVEEIVDEIYESRTGSGPEYSL